MNRINLENDINQTVLKYRNKAFKYEFNIHTHTKRCGHAQGEDREYVEHAIRNGIKVLGFSDHSPYCFDGDYYSGYRIRKHDIENYFSSINSLREEYKNDIKIYVGFEAEYYPKHFRDFINLISPYNPDYLILGQHFLNNEYDGAYSASPTNDENILKKYVSQCIEALDTGVFTYLAHPDLINFTGDQSTYEREMEKLCIHAKKLNIPLEINQLGLEENRTYPRQSFFRIAAKIGNKAIIGADAHRPEKVYNAPVIQKSLDFAENAGIEVLPFVELRNVRL